MFDEIMEKLEDSPSRRVVIRLLLERGFSVNDQRRAVSGGIKVLSAGVAHETEINRQVADSTTGTILDDKELQRAFQNISPTPNLTDLTPVLNLPVLTVKVADTDEPDIVTIVASKLVDADISIRQTISEDPEFTGDPELYIITDEPIPGDLLNNLSNLGFARRVAIA